MMQIQFTAESLRMSGMLLDADEIAELHRRAIESLHRDGVTNVEVGLRGIVCEQLKSNYLLWHEEDKVRALGATNDQIATAKRSIDHLNQQRNDGMERIDEWVTESLFRQGIAPLPGAPQNSESIGSIVDRLAILALRIFHLAEVADDRTATVELQAKARQRLVIAQEQRQDLIQALQLLAEDLVMGRKRHKTYRQLKLYNDPQFNPVLARRSS